jgi:hypothetical protein
MASSSLPSDQATAAERSRRVWQRLQSSRPLPRRISIAGSHIPLDAWIVDLSGGGTGVIVDLPVPVDSLLQFELETKFGVGPVQVWGHVVYCKEMADGEFRLGCRFVTPLDEADLTALLD